MLRSALASLARNVNSMTVRTYATQPIQPPTRLINLASLADNAGAVKQRHRVGRGPGSGRGKTAGRGHKGQNARSGNGKPTPGFEGGQTPLVKRIPKRGFYNIHRKEYQELNLNRLQDWIQSGRIDASKTITIKDLKDTRCIHKVQDGVKLLGVGAESFSLPITIEVSKASKLAVEAVEKAGGKVITRDYTAGALRALLHPEKHL